MDVNICAINDIFDNFSKSTKITDFETRTFGKRSLVYIYKDTPYCATWSVEEFCGHQCLRVELGNEGVLEYPHYADCSEPYWYRQEKVGSRLVSVHKFCEALLGDNPKVDLCYESSTKRVQIRALAAVGNLAKTYKSIFIDYVHQLPYDDYYNEREIIESWKN